MTFMEWADSKTKKLSVVDLALIKWSCISGGVLLAQLVPSLRRVDKRVLAVITIALAVKPVGTVLRAERSAH
jgi:hypothetical protein